MDELVLNNINKKYGRYTALEDFSLKIRTGMFGLLGPNGAGKTTLMRILATLLTPTKGNITLGHINWSKPQEVRKIIGYLPQKFSLYKNISVSEALEHIAILKGIKGSTKETVTSVIDAVNLKEHGNKKIGQLSGGMIRRVGIAQAILGQPKILIVDEPTAGLDPEERIRFRTILRDIGKDTIVIISSHIVEDIQSICEKVLVLNKGKIIHHGDVKEICQISKGKIWTFSIDEGDYPKLAKDKHIISSSFEKNRYHLKVYTESKPSNDAQSVDPSLEDSYFYLINKEHK